MADDNLIESIRLLLEKQYFGILATVRDGAPYTSLVAFSAEADLRHIIVSTNRATRKFTNLSSDERVSFLVDDTQNRESDLVEATAVTAQGIIRELQGIDRETCLSAYLERHPRLGDFAAAPSCALLSIEVEKYILVRRFQQVFEYRP